MMQGLDLKSLKKHPSLLPLYACFLVGLVGSAGYLFRLATRNPDVSWNKAKNPEPWQEFTNKQYKLYATEEQKSQKFELPKY